MRHSFLVTTGLCGFGITRGIWTEIRLGVVAIGWCRGSLRDHVAAKIAGIYEASNTAMQRAAQAARNTIKRRDA